MHSIYANKTVFFKLWTSEPNLRTTLVQDFSKDSVCHSSLIAPVLCFMNHTTVGPGPRPDPYNQPSLVSFCLKAIKLKGP